MERITGFINPGHDPSGAGFQAIQAKIALGSGGIFGVGLGESLQKAFYLPEAHTDMIAAVIGEELGLLGIGGLVCLYGLFGYAGPADRPERARPLRQAARRRAHLSGPGPGGDQPLRGARPGAADRRAAAVRLLRQLEHADDARRRRAAAQHLQVPVEWNTRVVDGAANARVVIAAGGTAGHVVPALAVADALRADGATVSFIGAARPLRGRAGARRGL